MTETRPCSQTTAAGEPCRNPAMHGSDTCVVHLRRAGRKTHLTEELAEQLLALIRSGNYLGVACRAVNLPRRTFGEWLERGKRGEEGDEPYVEFRAKVEQARAVGEARNVAAIASAAKESWQAAAWMLERQYPERWGRVSVRLRDPEAIPSEPIEIERDDDDPFREVDELAEKRRQRAS